MKKIVLILAMLLFTTSMAFGAHIEIGDGTSNTGYNPCYGFYNYSWSQTIYLQSEIGTTLDINAISYNISNTPSNYEMINQKIFMGHTPDTLFANNTLIDTIGMTKVFDGTVVWDGGGWNRVNFDTPFSYNNTDNLVIVWVNYDGEYASGYPRFYYTNQTDRMVYKYSDTIIPEPGLTGTLKYYVSNIRLHYPVPYEVQVTQLTPDATVIIPGSFNYFLEIFNMGLNNDTYDLSVDLTKDWTYAIRDKDDLGDITTIAINTGETDTVILKVTPPSGGGKDILTDTTAFIVTSQGDPTVSETTNITTTAYEPFTELFEDFEGCVEPDLPPAWSKIVQSTSTYPYVKTYESATYAHSGVMSVKMYNSSDLSAELLLITPALTTSANGNRVIFWARSSSGTQDLPVGIITDPTDPATFTALDTVEVTSTYTEYTFEYLEPTEDYIYLAVKHGLDGTYDSYYIDDIVYEEIPPVPVMVLSDTTYDFGWVEEGATPSWDVSITNSGSVDLIISDVTINPPFSCVYPDTILPSNTEVATIYLDASNPGIYEDVLTFNSNAIGGNTIELSAIVYGSDYVMEGFEALEFPPFGWSNPDGKWNRFTNNAYEGNGYARVSWYHEDDAILYSPHLMIEAGDFISFYWINANLYDGKDGKVNDADITYFEISNDDTNWEVLATLNPEEEMTEYEFVCVAVPVDYIGINAKVRWRHVTENIGESRGVGLDNVMLPPPYLPVNFYLDPYTQSDYDSIGATVAYDIDIYNTGIQADRYYISLAGSKTRGKDVEDFESDDGGYVGTGLWQWGSPTSGPGNAHSGVNVWATNLSGDYGTNANYTLDSPEIAIGSDEPTLTFWHWYDTENSFDGGNVKISTDGGATWTVIEPVGGYPGTSNSSNPLYPEPIFCGHGQGFWEQVTFDLSTYAGQTASFRWHLGSDSSVQYPGWYIDDVEVTGGGGPGPTPPEGWPVTFSDPYIDVEPGEMGTFTAYVEIPDDVQEDDVNTSTIYVESREEPLINHEADVVTTAHPKDPYEPNNTFADATPAEYGDVTEGAQIYYNPDYADFDVDIYKFDGSEGDVVYIVFDVADTLLFDGAIALFDADSVMLASADSYAGGVSETLQYRLLNDGTFYVMLGGWSHVLTAPFKKELERTETTTYYTASLELIPSPGVLVEPEEFTLGIIQGKNTVSDILYITNTGDEGAINLDWDIEIVIPGIDTLLDEGFDNFPPDGWTAEDNWAGSNSAYAGGTAPEAKFSWSPSFTGIRRLISPVINTEGYTSLPLKFKHYVNNFSGGYTLGVATTSDGGTTWNDVWTISPTANVGPETVSLTIDNADVGSDNFQVCWYFDGYSFNINYWYIDDVYLATGEAWVEADPVSGSVPQNQTGTSTITCDDTTLEPGVYTADIIVHNNAELYGASDVTVPLTLNVGEESGGLQGTVTFITTGEPIDSVEVTCGGFVAYTDSNGFYQFDPAPPIGIYNVKFERDGFLPAWADSVNLGYWTVVLDVQMYFDGPPPTDLVAEGKHLCIDLTWDAPSTGGGGTQVDYILDDGTYENGWCINPGYDAWLGNLFPVTDTGELVSFDLYADPYAGATTETVTIDVFDSAHNLVGTSEPFVIPAGTWTTVSAPNIPFDGEFYAMVHWNMLAGHTNWFGFDENGPNATANLDWYYDGSTWALLHVVAGADPGVFMLRATAMVQGELKEITAGVVDYTPGVLPEEEITAMQNSLSSNSIFNLHYLTPPDEPGSYEVTTLTRDLVLVGYNVYREDVTTGPIAYVPVEDPRYYRDEIVEVYVEYTYWVTAVYTVGESGPSNYASAIPFISGGWEETFDFDWHTTGWTLDPPSPNNWTWSPGYAMLNWSPSVTNYDMSLISPPIVLPDDPADVYDITVTMYINDYSTDTGEIMEIWIIHDGVETMIFDWDLDVNDDWGVTGGTDWVYTDTGQFAGETVQFKFRSHGGDTFNFNYWYVYNVLFDYAGVPPQYGALQGTVTDGWGNGIEGAELTVIGDLHPLGRYVVYTDELGYYEIDPIIAQEYDLTCVATGFTTYTAQFEVPPDSTVVHDIIMGNPEIHVTPEFVTITLDPNTQGTEFLTVSNAGNAPLGWYANIEFPDGTYGTNNGSIEDFGLEVKRIETSTVNELSPSYTQGVFGTRDPGDILLELNASAAAGETQCLGSEFDGTYFWATGGNSGADPNKLYKFDIDGNLLETYDQPSQATSWGIRDLAFDGTYLYGGCEYGLWQIDPADGTFTLLFTNPTSSCIRALAYRPSDNSFYTKSFGDPMYHLTMDGTVLETIPVPQTAAAYGMAWDDVNEMLWIFDQSGPLPTETTFFEFDTSTNTCTGVTYVVPLLTGSTEQIAGGAFFATDLIPGTAVLGGMTQGTPDDMIFAMELCPAVTWIRIDPTSGTVPPGGDSLVTVYFDATDLEVGTIKTADIHFFSIPDVGEPIIPATLIVGTPEYGNLDGTVIDSSSTDPIEGVLVTATSSGKQVYTDTTDVNGYYLIEDMLTGLYDVTFENEGYNIGLVEDAEILDDQTTTVNYTMTSPELTYTPASFTFQTTPGDSVVDTLYVENIGTGPVDFDIDIEYIYDKSRQSILCVDRDGSSTTGYTDDWPYFQAALDAAGYSYTYYEVTDLTQDGPDLATMQLYDVIIWFSGEAWGYFDHDCMTDNDEINLAAYLDGGGTLFLSAQDYFWASYPSAGNFSAGQFPYDYLGMRSVTQDNWLVGTSQGGPPTGTIEGVAGSLADGYTFDVQDIYSAAKDGLYIDWLTDFVADGLFNVTSPTPEGICGIQYDAMTFRTVFTSASFAAITDPVVQTNLIDDIIQWLSIPQWLSVDPDAGTIDPSTIAPLTVTANSEGLENNITYSANIHVNTANPDIGETVIQVEFTVVPDAVGTGETLPTVTKLNSNFPNPFGHSTTISFSLKAKSHVKLSVYNMRGQLVATLIDDEMSPANHTVVWNGRNGNVKLANGIYFYKLEADKKTFIKKMLLMR